MITHMKLKQTQMRMVQNTFVRQICVEVLYPGNSYYKHVYSEESDICQIC